MVHEYYWKIIKVQVSPMNGLARFSFDDKKKKTYYDFTILLYIILLYL